ncbi:hypothetical protein TRIHO_03910 [Tritonibacter horizontis]|uniref:Uncharacterized protein n=1 Tax=Tritonibacter horizontis TaxID=1768241 RepID=A0A132C2A6_9RHOB|nr:hypothetical protein TRIHO_03910 [Tritonibacter horizontis]
MAVTFQRAVLRHAPHARLGIGAGGLAVFGDVPDMFQRRWRRGHRCRLGLRLRRSGCGPRAPGAGGMTRCLRRCIVLHRVPHLLGHRHAHSHPEPGAHPAVGRRGGGFHRLGGLELGVAAKIADDPHLGALVHGLFDSRRQRDILDVKLGDRQAVLGHDGADFGGHQLAQVGGIRGHVQHRDAGPCDGARKLLHDDVADLVRDLVHGEFTIGADDLGQEARRVHHPHGVGSKGAQTDRAEFRVATHDRILGAPFEVIEPGCGDKVDLGFERRLKAMVPMLQRGQDRHVVGLKHIKTGSEDIRQLAFVDEHRRLAFAHRQLGAVFDGVAFPFKPGDHRMPRIVRPMDDVDKFPFEKVENTQGASFRVCLFRCSNPAAPKPEPRGTPGRKWHCGENFPRHGTDQQTNRPTDQQADRPADQSARSPITSRAIRDTMGRASSALMPTRRRGS